MLFKLPPAEKPALQRQLDADRMRWSRQLQQATDAAFEAEEIDAFRMTGLYGQIPGADRTPMRMPPRS